MQEYNLKFIVNVYHVMGQLIVLIPVIQAPTPIYLYRRRDVLEALIKDSDK